MPTTSVSLGFCHHWPHVFLVIASEIRKSQFDFFFALCDVCCVCVCARVFVFINFPSILVEWIKKENWLDEVGTSKDMCSESELIFGSQYEHQLFVGCAPEVFSFNRFCTLHPKELLFHERCVPNQLQYFFFLGQQIVTFMGTLKYLQYNPTISYTFVNCNILTTSNHPCHPSMSRSCPHPKAQVS